jgi:predicted DNA-binding antitoxin AbrB/MazE fold protein
MTLPPKPLDVFKPGQRIKLRDGSTGEIIVIGRKFIHIQLASGRIIAVDPADVADRTSAAFEALF